MMMESKPRSACRLGDEWSFNYRRDLKTGRLKSDALLIRCGETTCPLSNKAIRMDQFEVVGKNKSDLAQQWNNKRWKPGDPVYEALTKAVVKQCPRVRQLLKGHLKLD